MNSSVFASWRFMYESTDTRNPLYSIPHFSLTMTGFPVCSFRNGFGLTGTLIFEEYYLSPAGFAFFSDSGPSTCAALHCVTSVFASNQPLPKELHSENQCGAVAAEVSALPPANRSPMAFSRF
eukprot:TRINITY_DN16743_c0_g1_i1.p1 TRINITY_DN16743_c0_g1~~TRINITY_DN16743_c0_g1_i1.p1  ORF type:complete len:123 (-),score=0.50 TRINITY_DN16743_c0_g1_i1:101-469(-)